MSIVAPPKKPPPPTPAPSKAAGPTPSTMSTASLSVSRGVKSGAMKTVLYSSGGAGKTSLAANIEQCGIKPLFLDLEQGSAFVDVARIDTITTWDELRAVLHDESIWSDYSAVVVDSLTRAEEMAVAWTVRNVPHPDKGVFVNSLEGYGFGKGFTFVYETFLQLLADLDAHVRRDRHVICTAHECTASVPNPAGEDFIRYEPRLQSPSSGKASIRHRVKEWCDHLAFIGFDSAVSKDGKAVGSGTRTIYTTELPCWWAKSRCLSEPIVYEKNSAELWKQILQGRST